MSEQGTRCKFPWPPVEPVRLKPDFDYAGVSEAPTRGRYPER
jgi:hypothetical protein